MYVRIYIYTHISLLGRMVSMSYCHPGGLGFDSRLYHTNFYESIVFGTKSMQLFGAEEHVQYTRGEERITFYVKFL